ncbi:SNF2-related protein [Lactococcus lactis]|uniref:SNF2-related protein n=1 Tax=Lactococcus lactis TaxID=1358 RepID=UPI0018C5134D|nr:SNF2-related protein [Lactococcus lactis]MBG1279317.1 hypothetical protein [Lactococcus lactis subsp. lactis]
MNRNEAIEAQGQFIAEFQEKSDAEKLEFLRFNRYHHLRPIGEIISIFVQNPEARFLGSFDFWKNLTTESSVRFGQKSNVRIWDRNGRVQEVLYDLAQTTLRSPLEIKDTLLSDQVFFNTLADLSGNDYSIDELSVHELEVQTAQFIEQRLMLEGLNLSGYSERQQAVARQIAQYNLIEEFGVLMDSEGAFEDIGDQVAASFSLLQEDDNLLRTFSLANSFSRHFVELINGRYETVAELTADLRLGQTQLNHQLDELSTDQVFEVENNFPAQSSVELTPKSNTINSGNDTTNLSDNEEDYRGVIADAYSTLHASYMRQQDLKAQGMNVSGSYDTYDVTVPSGNLQFGYHFLGRSLDTDDDSKVIFYVSGDNFSFETTPMSVAIRSKALEVFTKPLEEKLLDFSQTEISPEGQQTPQTIKATDLMTSMGVNVADSNPVDESVDARQLNEPDVSVNPPETQEQLLRDELDVVEELITMLQDGETSREILLEDELVVFRIWTEENEQYARHLVFAYEIPNAYEIYRVVWGEHGFNNENFSYELAKQLHEHPLFGDYVKEKLLEEWPELGHSETLEEKEIFLPQEGELPVDFDFTAVDNTLATLRLEKNETEASYLVEMEVFSNVLENESQSYSEVEVDFKVAQALYHELALKLNESENEQAIFEVGDELNQAVAGASTTYESVGDELATEAIPTTLSTPELLEATIDHFKLERDNFQVIEGFNEVILNKVSFGGVLNEYLVTYDGEDFEISDVADSLTGIKNFKDKFEHFRQELTTNLSRKPSGKDTAENNDEDFSLLDDEELNKQIIENYGRMAGADGQGYSPKAFTRWAKLREEEIRRGLQEETQEISLFDTFEPLEESAQSPLTVEGRQNTGNITSKDSGNITPNSNFSQERHDFSFPETEDFYPHSTSEKIEANLSAIRLVKELEKSQSLATPEQQIILGKYVGWGGLADDMFDESNPRFEAQRQELKNLVSNDEYVEMRRSSLTAYYTDPKIIQTIYQQLERFGFKEGRILDPSMGTGNFFAAMPERLKNQTQRYGVEIDRLTGLIAYQLNQQADVQIKGFEESRFMNDAMDVVITNVPFSDVLRISDEQYDSVYPIHDYFIKKSLDLVHEGGFVAVITSTGTMDKKDSRFREEISKVANLVSAVRLPSGAFKAIAGTEVSSDILIFQKTSSSEVKPEWLKTKLIEDEKGNQITVNQHFINSPHTLLGQIKIQSFNGGMLSVSQDFQDEELVSRIDEPLSSQTAHYEQIGRSEEVFESVVQLESEIPQDVLDLVEPYTIFVYRNKPYYFDGKQVTPHQKTSSVILQKGETRKRQLSRYENNKSNIFKEKTNYQQVAQATGYLDSWDNFIPTKSPEKSFPEIPRQVLEKIANGAEEVVEGDYRYRYVKEKLQSRLVVEEATSTQYRYKLDYSSKDVQAMQKMIELRHNVQAVLNIQHIPDYDQAEYEELRDTLNTQYDRFVNEFGPISSQANSLLMRSDDYYEFLASIEEEVEDELTTEPKLVKGAVFFEPTIQPQAASIHVNNAADALLASLNHKGKLDFEYMESVYGHSKEEMITELGNKLFYVGNGEYQTREDYLSGDVKTKLIEAQNNQAFQLEERSWSKNIEALEKVVPKDLPLSDITYKFGSRFIPLSVYQSFLSEVMDSQATVQYDKTSDSYTVALTNINRFASTDTYGYKGYNGQKLATVLLNQKPGKIYMLDPNDPKGKKRVLDHAATAVLEEKGRALMERFRQWVDQNLEVQEMIVDIYNEQFNRYVVKTYDGSGLTINGLAKQFQPRPHQKNAIMRTVQDLRAGYAHEVGSGKTLTMLASNMKLQELDMVHNPLFVIPKPLINQFAKEIYKYFPESKVLVAHSEDFTKAGRKRFISRIATGNYNAIIIADSQFGKIAMSNNYQENYIRNQLFEARSMMEQADQESFTVKQAEKAVEALKARLKKLQKEDTDTFITFEELGIDMLYVDEAHGFKNLAPFTQLENVKGVSNTRAEKAMDLMMKVEYMHSLYNNRRVVFSTGTPMSNSVVELYTMMKFIEPDVLEKYGVANFDSWVSSFGIIEDNFELTAAGTFKINSRFTKFGNVPELMNMFREAWDIQTQEMLNLPVPHAEMIAHETAVTGEQARYIENLIQRAEAIEAGEVKPYEDNMLKIVGENRKLTLDMRALDDKLYSAFDSDKLNQVVDEVFRIYKENDEKKSTQMIFSDLSVPVKYRNSQPQNSDGSINMFSAYDEIKKMLVERGLPESEVRFIHEATDKNKEAMMRDMRQGKIRVLIGSTSKAGTGLNVQNKMVAIHHLDVPWRPADITQRNGRLIRQGNENENVSVHYYITKGSMDAFLWQTQENKAKVINQIMSGNSDLREMEEIGDTQINMGKYKAIAEGDPVRQEYMQLEMKFQELERSRTRFFDSKITDLKRVKSAKEQLPTFEKRLENVHQDIEFFAQNKEKPFEIDIFYKGSSRHFDASDKKSEVAEFLARQIQNQLLQHRIILSRMSDEKADTKLANYRGFEVIYLPEQGTMIGGVTEERIMLKREAQYSLSVNPASPLGIFSRIDNFLENGLNRDVSQTQEEVDRLNSSILSIEKSQDMSYPKEEEYQASKERLHELRELMNDKLHEQEQSQEKTQELTR